MTSAPRILILTKTTGYQTEAFTAAAGRLGYEVVLATDRCHVLEDPWGDHALSLRFEQPEESSQWIAGNLDSVDGIVAIGDAPVYIAALAAGRLGLRYNSPEAVQATRNKYLARERFAAAGLPVPRYYRLPLDTHSSGAPFYPCVLKPLGLSGSRGVIRADDATAFRFAIERIRAILRSADIQRMQDESARFIQVEEFIPGREFALEGLLTGGRLHTLTIFDKPEPLDGPYFEETIYLTPSRQPEPVQGSIRTSTQRAVDALGLTEGPVHAEMRVNEQGVWMLEIASRPIGGLCAQVLPGLEELVLRHAAGAGCTPRAYTESAGVLMIPIPRGGRYNGVEGLEEASQVPGIERIVITAKQGQTLVPLPEGSSYLGFIFARGADPQRALREAHQRLRFEVLAELPVV